MPPFVLAALRGTFSESKSHAASKRPLELLPVRARVAATLWTLARRHGRSEAPFSADGRSRVKLIDLNLTREEIAHLAGTVYESVIRTLTGLRKEGVIDLQGRVIRILQIDQLARVGQIAKSDSDSDSEVKGEVKGEFYDQNSVSKNRYSANNRSPSEAC